MSEELPPQGGDSPWYFIAGAAIALGAYGAYESWVEATKEREKNFNNQRSK